MNDDDETYLQAHVLDVSVQRDDNGGAAVEVRPLNNGWIVRVQLNPDMSQDESVELTHLFEHFNTFMSKLVDQMEAVAEEAPDA